MRKCKYKLVGEDFIEGIFHQWGTASVIIEKKTEVITIGIVEDENGYVHKVPISSIVFIEGWYKKENNHIKPGYCFEEDCKIRETKCEISCCHCLDKNTAVHRKLVLKDLSKNDI